MHCKVIIVSMVSTITLVTQVAAFPTLKSGVVVPGAGFEASGGSAMVSVKREHGVVLLSPRTNTNPEKHEANEQKDKASAAALEAKEQDAKKKSAEAAKKGDTAQAAKNADQADREEAKEQTALAHADAAEKKEQAAKANEKDD